MKLKLRYCEQAQSTVLSLPPAPSGTAAQAGHKDAGTQSCISAPVSETALQNG